LKASFIFIIGKCLGAGIVNRLRAGRLCKLGAIPHTKKDSILFPVDQIASGAHSASHSTGTRSC